MKYIILGLLGAVVAVSHRHHHHSRPIMFVNTFADPPKAAAAAPEVKTKKEIKKEEEAKKKEAAKEQDAAEKKLAADAKKEVADGKAKEAEKAASEDKAEAEKEAKDAKKPGEDEDWVRNLPEKWHENPHSPLQWANSQVESEVNEFESEQDFDEYDQ